MSASSKNNNLKKSDKEDLETQQPLSEKDEVKKAEKRTQELHKKNNNQKGK